MMVKSHLPPIGASDGESNDADQNGHHASEAVDLTTEVGQRTAYERMRALRDYEKVASELDTTATAVFEAFIAEDRRREKAKRQGFYDEVQDVLRQNEHMSVKSAIAAVARRRDFYSVTSAAVTYYKQRGQRRAQD